MTTYQIDEEDGSLRRVEIIHESLLSSWPRLVRWQTQDADSARLRDELRQAARMWDDHERGNDYLWSGKAFRAFSVWREDYPGGLTTLEEEFAGAMTSLATRRRRARRNAGVAILAALLAVLAVVGTLWQRSVQQAHRAEAANLLALGHLQLEDYPTATLAHAVASLELTDTPGARHLALQALWEGPTAFVINEDDVVFTSFAANGDWLVQEVQTMTKGHFQTVTKDGSITLFDRVHDSTLARISVNPEGTVMYSAAGVSSGVHQNAVLWSLPDGQRIYEAWFDPPISLLWLDSGWNSDRFLMPVVEGDQPHILALNFDGTTDRLGEIDLDVDASTMDPYTGRWFATIQNARVVVIGVGEHDLSSPRFLGRHDGTDHRMAFDPEGRLLATSSRDGQIKNLGSDRGMLTDGYRWSARH